MVKNKSSKNKKAKKVKEGEAFDAEVAAQVKEVEERLQVLTVEMKQVEGKIKHCMLEAKRAELTEKELKPMPDTLKVYRQVGKMFILQPKADMAKSLKAQVAVKTLECQGLQQARNKIQEKVKSEADGLKELIGPERMKQLFQSGGAPEVPAGGTRPEDAVMPIFGKESKAAQSEAESKPAESEKAGKARGASPACAARASQAPESVEV
ncbi:unnamed protein product [Effrenium voratum]|nr:unnamed protein product [Effrenium voratum]CAJ1426625.1 unnamed protein product [Effrenium voratum]